MNENDLDPDIRRVVMTLRAEGFNTTDSGDGVSKGKAGWEVGSYIETPHVYMRVEPECIAVEARRLKSVVESWGCIVEPLGVQTIWIDCTYDPSDDIALIGLFGVTDRVFL